VCDIPTRLQLCITFNAFGSILTSVQLPDDIDGSYRFRYSKVASKQEVDTLIAESQQCLDYQKGPLLAADFFDFNGDQYVFLTADHIVIDLVSWRLLLEELEDILRGDKLVPATIPLQKWAELQAEHAETLELHKVLPQVEVPPLDFSYWGIQREHNTYGNATHALFELEAEDTSLFLGSCHRAYKTEPVELLLASLIQSWSRVFVDRSIPAVFNEGHGREPWSPEIDISRTVGWFTACEFSCAFLRTWSTFDSTSNADYRLLSVAPIVVTPSEKSSETVRMVKDFKRRIPGNGRPYFAKRCLTEEGRQQYSTHWPMEILFNYLGQYQVSSFGARKNLSFLLTSASNWKEPMRFSSH
jgi:hypothetical protein